MIDRKDFLRCINLVLYSYKNTNTDDCINCIKHLLYRYHNLDKVVYENLIDKDSSSGKICRIANGLEILYEYSLDHYTQEGIAEMVISCYARAFILSPFREKHIIAYRFNHFLDKTYYTYYNPQQKVSHYCSYLGNFFFTTFVLGGPRDDYYDKECEAIYRAYWIHTPDGDVCKCKQRLGKLIQWYLLSHVKHVNEINPCLLSLKNDELVSSIEDCYSYLCKIDSTKLKKLAIQLLASLLEDYTDESLNNTCYIDFRDYLFDDETCLIEMHDYMEEAKEDFENYLEHNQQNHVTDNSCDDEYGKYAGTYAQDVAGYSDDDIDTIFDGDPSAYWNID